MEEKTSILHIIKTRRSTRRFKPDPVPEEDLNAVLEAARWAPSGENFQPWKFIVIKNKQTMEQIVELLPYKKYQKFLQNGPVLLVVLGDRRKSRWWFLDCTLAVENLMLEAWARQLGTCFSAWYPTVPEQVEQKVNEMLEIPKKWRIVTMTPLGYPIDPPERAFRLPATRNPLDTLVCYEKFSK
ncbi:MAG: nitroreductase family protein [Candidatus Helarchaeota archaeon]|nr:nitroreductase family protein [Candidatus Helarchaeota archaeon]